MPPTAGSASRFDTPISNHRYVPSECTIGTSIQATAPGRATSDSKNSIAPAAWSGWSASWSRRSVDSRSSQPNRRAVVGLA
ncbi:MAG: hypothetical protein KatS3mg009_1969 [Acidimicrobiia bacterium]|nr:MAG: hypothetical protein KatS3mg009_1969 [Acidimicrobiia bacterium]